MDDQVMATTLYLATLAMLPFLQVQCHVATDYGYQGYGTVWELIGTVLGMRVHVSALMHCE